MRRRSVLRGLGGAAATLAAPSLWADPRTKLVIGQSAAMTGPAAQLGIQFAAGARLMFDRINASGGINGKTIELKTLDDGYEPDRCAANTKKLIDEDVFALFGYIGTPTSVVALPLATSAKIPFLAPFTGAQGLREPFNRYAFHVRASYFDETARIVNQLYSVGMKNIAVFYQNDAYGQAGLAGVNRALAALGSKPVALGTVERNTVDVAAAVKAIVPSRPEGIVQISAYKSCAAFIRAARKAGAGGQFCNVSFVGTAALAAELGADARGVVVSQVMPYPFAPKSSLAGEFLKAAPAAKVEANYSSIEGYVAAKVLGEGLRRAGTNPTRETLITGLESMKDVNLGGFFVDFGPTKHTGSSFVDLTILTDDGRVRH
ncbi:MAG: ABC transporter substrate-binding protein [Burkholderiaceae bacterium]|nr:ABC transporter substrate-binding protein [Burkholderiaceae bacterium]